MNEPRCTAQSICTDDGVTTIHAWVAMMSTYVKGIDRQVPWHTWHPKG